MLSFKKTSFIFLFLSYSCATSQDKNIECEFPYIKFSKEQLSKRASWRPELFSDVNHHDPKNFSYIIHKIDKTHRLKERIPEESWTYKILENPETIQQSLLVSGSVVSQDHLASAFAPESRVGFMLSASCDLIGPAFSKDMLSQRPRNLSEAPEVWGRLARRFPKVLTPQDILSELKGSYYYNEVTMIGTHPADSSHKIKIAALLIECGADKNDLHHGTMAKWSGQEKDLDQCLDGYRPKKQVLPLLKKIAKKYPVMLKKTLDHHQYDLLDKRNILYPD